MVKRTTTPALTTKKTAASANAYFAEERKDNFKVLNFSEYIAKETASVNTEIKIVIKIKELFCENKSANRPAEIKLANKASWIEFISSFLLLIKDKNETDKAIKANITTIKAPDMPTVDSISNKIPEALSKRTFQRGELLKFIVLNFEKS